MRTVMTTARPDQLKEFIKALTATGNETVVATSAGQALALAADPSVSLVVVDSSLPDSTAFRLVTDLMGVNAMINTAVLSDLPAEQFHEASEGLGILTSLPLAPTPDDAERLISTLRSLN